MVNQEMLSTKRFSTLQSTSTLLSAIVPSYTCVPSHQAMGPNQSDAAFGVVDMGRRMRTFCITTPFYLLKVLFWAPSFRHTPAYRHVNQWGPNKQYYMFSMDTEQNQPPRIPLEPSKMRFRSHLNVCNSLASHALPWPFTRHKINLLKLQALTSSDIDSRVMTYNGESRNFVYKEVLQ